MNNNQSENKALDIFTPIMLQLNTQRQEEEG